MAELSDDTLSDDDALKRDEELEEGHPMRGLVFHWSTHGFWGSKALGDDDRAWADDNGLCPFDRRGHRLSAVIARAGLCQCQP